MIPRLYIDADLETGAAAALASAQAHYLKNVLRRETGSKILLFNGRHGEFEATLVELKKKGGLASIAAQRRPQESEFHLSLLFAPVKRSPLETIIQKGTELGVSHFCPILTERTVTQKLNIERLQAIAIEASEQCGRLTVPSIEPVQKLATLLNSWPEGEQLIFCDEAGDDETKEWGGRVGRAAPALDALRAIDRKDEALSVLTGPEGGFTPAERTRIRDTRSTTAVTLGPRILRADTAALAALVLVQAARGDWRKS